MLALQQYGSSDEEDNSVKVASTPEIPKVTEEINPEYSVQKQLQVCATPVVFPSTVRSY